jgi:hypothetical protein
MDGAAASTLPGVRALFQQRVPGDDALLRLAARRFSEAGMPAELYADSPDQLEHLLSFVPKHDTLPTVHLSRSANVLQQSDRELIESFATRFAGRVAGLVVHDKAGMAERLAELVAAMRALGATSGARVGRPTVYLEYATGLPIEAFISVAEQLADVELASMCIDIGHVGIQHARDLPLASTSGVAWSNLSLTDTRLPEVVDQVQAATRSAVRAVLELIDRVARIGKPVHYHLHDGHPLVRGLADHFSFFTRFPVPFEISGAYALPSMFGPSGLAAVLEHAVRSSFATPSLTLEIHQVEGRLPLDAAAELFTHWRDLTNGERMNYWLSVLADNHLLATTLLERVPGS